MRLLAVTLLALTAFQAGSLARPALADCGSVLMKRDKLVRCSPNTSTPTSPVTTSETSAPPTPTNSYSFSGPSDSPSVPPTESTSESASPTDSPSPTDNESITPTPSESPSDTPSESPTPSESSTAPESPSTSETTPTSSEAPQPTLTCAERAPTLKKAVFDMDCAHDNHIDMQRFQGVYDAAKAQGLCNTDTFYYTFSTCHLEIIFYPGDLSRYLTLPYIKNLIPSLSDPAFSQVAAT
ncbi:hypothetical protein IWQ60_011967 [Tieghemiomyces parasiticus]|uniref:Uncharacterized protein n=1 Tax=Tieghemiomyces parasiticus TaxID=78921 RepID=A0A9W7ZG62_9FUNG|nr:hypothetical protein IWQ60_011967 [Tieghemiomyces parasiticus]